MKGYARSPNQKGFVLKKRSFGFATVKPFGIQLETENGQHFFIRDQTDATRFKADRLKNEKFTELGLSKEEYRDRIDKLLPWILTKEKANACTISQVVDGLTMAQVYADQSGGVIYRESPSPKAGEESYWEKSEKGENIESASGRYLVVWEVIGP